MSAIISPCGRYRYRLERKLGPISVPEITGAVIMVNPSTADAVENDPTIVKLIGFGERAGWSKLIVGNLFAYRATDVSELAKADDPEGPGNNAHLHEIMAEANVVIFAWGSMNKLPPRLRTRWQRVCRIAVERDHQPLMIGPPCNDGHPKHPVRLAYSLPLLPWGPPSC